MTSRTRLGRPGARPGRATIAAVTIAAVTVVAAALGAAVVPTSAAGTGAPSARVTAVFPASHARVGSVLAVTGQVSGEAGRRVVQVQTRATNGTWVTLAATRTRPNGRFRLDAPTWWVGTHTLRAHAPATLTSPAATSTTTARITVAPTSRPRAGTAHAFESANGARWNPCQPITYRLNPHLMPAGARRDLAKVFAQVSQATGLRFVYAGSSTYVPYSGTARKHPADADIVLAWSTPATVAALSGSTAGRAGATWAGSGSRAELYDGEAVFDAAQRLSRSGSDQHRLTMQLYLHEVGHVVGLDHVNDKRQLMYPTVQLSADPTYGAGDLAGLAALGAAQGCTGVGAR